MEKLCAHARDDRQPKSLSAVQAILLGSHVRASAWKITSTSSVACWPVMDDRQRAVGIVTALGAYPPRSIQPENARNQRWCANKGTASTIRAKPGEMAAGASAIRQLIGDFDVTAGEAGGRRRPQFHPHPCAGDPATQRNRAQTVGQPGFHLFDKRQIVSINGDTSPSASRRQGWAGRSAISCNPKCPARTRTAALSIAASI